MARIDSALRPATSIRLMREQRIDNELAALFGRDLVEQAKQTDPADLLLSDSLMVEVYTAADELLARAGEPVAQRSVVRRLSEGTRLVLCMWIHDLDLAAKITACMVRQAA